MAVGISTDRIAGNVIRMVMTETTVLIIGVAARVRNNNPGLDDKYINEAFMKLRERLR